MWSNKGLMWALVAMAVVASASVHPAVGLQLSEPEEVSHVRHLSTGITCFSSNPPNYTTMECGGLQSLQQLFINNNGHLPEVKHLTIANSSIDTFALRSLVNMSALNSLVISNSRVAEWRMPAGVTLPQIKELTFIRSGDTVTDNHLTLVVTTRMLAVFPNLKRLKLIECYLTHLEDLNPLKQLQNFTIEGGGVECQQEDQWLWTWLTSGRVSISNSTICYYTSIESGGLHKHAMFHKENFLKVLQHRNVCDERCEAPCVCTLQGLHNNMPLIFVECDGRGLTEMPRDIPPMSTKLFFSHNNITSIEPLFTNSQYQYAQVIQLVKNSITEIDGDLLYRYFHNRTTELVIDLSYNRLTSLPLWTLKRLDEEARVSEGKRGSLLLVLDNNPWNCNDCSFFPDFHYMLHLKYMDMMYTKRERNSIDEIRCGAGNDDFAGKQVIKLDVKDLCGEEPPPLTPIAILNICLGVLLLLFIINFLYNLIQYRRHGNLPWIVTRSYC